MQNENIMSILKKIAVGVILVVLLLVAVYATFAFILISSDHARYWAPGINIGNIDYDDVISNAENAGYKVEDQYFFNVKTRDAQGMRSPGIEELDERLGEEYLVQFVEIYYSENSYISAEVSEEGGTTIIFFNDDRPDPYDSPFELQHLPEDGWILEQLRLMFGLDEKQAQGYLTKIKETITSSQTRYPQITIKEIPDLSAVYGNLRERSTNSTVSPTSGEGGSSEIFYRNGTKIGSIRFAVQNMRIIFNNQGQEYIVRVDRMGGVAPSIKLKTGETIPEDDCKGVFRDMFNELGLPPAMVDEYKFNYAPSLW